MASYVEILEEFYQKVQPYRKFSLTHTHIKWLCFSCAPNVHSYSFQCFFNLGIQDASEFNSYVFPISSRNFRGPFKPLPTLPTAIIKLWLDAAVEGDEQMTVELEKDKKKTTGKK